MVLIERREQIGRGVADRLLARIAA